MTPLVVKDPQVLTLAVEGLIAEMKWELLIEVLIAMIHLILTQKTMLEINILAININECILLKLVMPRSRRYICLPIT